MPTFQAAVIRCQSSEDVSDYRSPISVPRLELARRSRLHVTRGARIDLLFTMSDNTSALRQKSRALEWVLTNEPAQDLRAPRFAGAWRRQTVWWSQTGSNRRPPACKAGALPTELWPPQGTDISNQQSVIGVLKQRDCHLRLPTSDY